MVFLRRIAHSLQFLRVGYSEHNPLVRIKIAFSGENLVYAPVIIHHINSLSVPLHREALRHIIKLPAAVLIRCAGYVIKLDNAHYSLHFSQMDRHLALSLHFKTAPGQLRKAVFKSHFPQ